MSRGPATKIRAAALLVLVASMVGASRATSPADGRTASCKPGVTAINGVSARVFCGPAKATVHVRVGTKGARTYIFENGKCDRFPRYFDLNIGKVVLGLTAKRKPPYFGLLMGKSPAGTSEDPVVSKDGTYKGGLITIEAGSGASYDLHGRDQLTITLRKRRHAGSFVGQKPGSTLFKQPAIAITGSFTCGS